MISTAFAQTATEVQTTTEPGLIMGGGSDLFTWAPIILFLLLMYFMMIRPQQKRAKDHKNFLEGLQVGDEVLLAGGILGRVRKLNETYVVVEIAKGVEIQIQKNAIHAAVPKNTIADF